MIILLILLMPVIGMIISDTFVAGFITSWAMIAVAVIAIVRKK